MRKNINNLSKQDLIVLANNMNANLQKLSQLYIKSKTENEYLKRKNKIVEDRLNHLKALWEKRIGCKLKFTKIDSIIRKENRLKKRIKVEFEGR